MDLGTMSKKLASHHYKTMEEFRTDMELIFSNCKIFNPPATYPVEQAVLLEILFRREWTKASEKKLSTPEKRLLSSILTNLMSADGYAHFSFVSCMHSPWPRCGWLFSEPVDPVLLGIPTYFEVVPRENARDLKTIKGKLERDKYDSVDALEADLLLMVNNAITFNGPESDVGIGAYRMQATYQSALETYRTGGKKRKDGDRGTSQPSKKVKIS